MKFSRVEVGGGAFLPCETQIVLLLWAVDELSLENISYALSMPTDSVHHCLMRAKQKL